ncbi:MAG: hypothetical protein ACLFWB_05675 [Armatimonadota bacterium]
METKKSSMLCPFKAAPQSELRMGSHQPRKCDGFRCALWDGDQETGQCGLKTLADSLKALASR